MYDEDEISRQQVVELSGKLSDWYFSECGGLLLTPQARDFYFALQDLLRSAAQTDDEWSLPRSGKAAGDDRDAFGAELLERYPNAGPAWAYLSADEQPHWQTVAIQHGKAWREGIQAVAGAWGDLSAQQRFATLQQVGSKLRTVLAADLESRAG